MLSSIFPSDTVVRVARTFAQALAAIFTASGAGLLDADWTGALSGAGMAALLSLLMSVGNGTTGGDNPYPEPTEDDTDGDGEHDA